MEGGMQEVSGKINGHIIINFYPKVIENCGIKFIKSCWIHHLSIYCIYSPESYCNKLKKR